MAIAEIPFQRALTLNRDTLSQPFSLSRGSHWPVSLRRTIFTEYPDQAHILGLKAVPVLGGVYSIDELSDKQGKFLVATRLVSEIFDWDFSQHVLYWGARKEYALPNGQTVELAEKKYGLYSQLREITGGTITGRQIVEFYREELGKIEDAARLGTLKLENLR